MIKHYAGTTKPFFEFQGLAPQPGMNNESQLVNLAEQIAINFRCSQPILHNWTEAFSELADRIRVNNAVVLLDELSCLGPRLYVGPTESADKHHLLLATCYLPDAIFY